MDCIFVQMAVVLEGMADGGVMTGIPRAMSQRIAAYTMLVRLLQQFVCGERLIPSFLLSFRVRQIWCYTKNYTQERWVFIIMLP